MMGSSSFAPSRSWSAAALLLLAATAFPGAHVSALQTESAATTAAVPAVPGSEQKLTERSWKLISLNGHDLDPKILKPPQMTLVEDGSRILGYSGCNRFLGTYSLQQDKLFVNNDLVATHRACRLEMNVETDFLKVLPSIDSWKIVDGVLELSRDKQVLARFK